MLVLILAYLGGVLTILSPCILPVLPFVFARADQPFLKSGLPLLAGMALTFALVATLAAVGGGWVTQANEYGRWIAIVLLAFFGITLLLPKLADHLMRPLVSAGNHLAGVAQRDGGQPRIASSLLLGVATGLLWAPCAGPILGLLLTGAALHGANVGTTLLLVAYAAGAATSLGAALLIGGRLFTMMKRSLGTGEWIRRGIGAAMLCGVVAIAMGVDTGILTRISTVTTANLEQNLIDKIRPQITQTAGTDNRTSGAMMQASLPLSAGARVLSTLPDEGPMPSLSGAVDWLNSPPLTADALHGKVVLLDVWTYSCINCLRTLPYVKAWAEKYKDQGLVVIGVHAPEFAFERNIDNVKKAVHDLGINYPVAIDNQYAIWKGLNNQYWPAHYFIDAKGRIRAHHFGEGDYAGSEKIIRQLLAEAGHKVAVSDATETTNGSGVMAAADDSDMRSPETYIGYERTAHFSPAGGQREDEPFHYQVPALSHLNDWGLEGDWIVSAEQAALQKATGKIDYRFHARDLHLVLGPGTNGKPVRFRVMLDGLPPGAAHGSDTDANGYGVIGEQRLYQLVRQSGAISDKTFSIEFLDAGAQAYAFTFG